MRISLGRRVIEPESFVSSSCVGDQFQTTKRRLIEKRAPSRPSPATDDRTEMHNSVRIAQLDRKQFRPIWIPARGQRPIVVKEPYRRQESRSVDREFILYSYLRNVLPIRPG